MGSSPFFLATATSKRLLCRLCYCFLWPMRKHLTGSSYITGTPFPHLHLVQTPQNVIMCVWASPISISTTLKKKVQIPVSCSVVYYSCWHAGTYTVEPVNTDTSGSKKFCKIIGLAILPGRVKCTIHCIHTCWTAVLFNEQLEYRYCVQYYCKNYLKVFFSTKSTFKNWLLNRHKCILIVL